MSKPQRLVEPEGSGKVNIFKDLIGTRTHDLPASSVMLQQATLTNVEP
jgi:Fe-S cluster assembly ATPase SufC